MLSHVWKNGKPQLKRLSELPTTKVTILQPDGTRVPITLKDVDNAKKKLGVYCSPTGNFTTHDDIIIQTGLIHASCLKGRPITPRDARKSVDLALIPKILYGGVAVTHPPAQLLKAFHNIYYNLLPQLGINRNITREYRMLPQKYQGLGLPNRKISKLSAQN